jgi:hypothetical protein
MEEIVALFSAVFERTCAIKEAQHNAPKRIWE